MVGDIRHRIHSPGNVVPALPGSPRAPTRSVAPGQGVSPRRSEHPWCDDGPVHEAAMPAARSIPQVIAHRGSSRDLPEHTLKAYLRAIAEGADALECDVRLTADSHLVCAHDRNVNRTSNGKGPVSTLELATLEMCSRWSSARCSSRASEPVTAI